jgi:hypothetical protein
MLSDKNLAELKASLFAGQYNLLLGTGISLDSHQKNGTPLTSASELAKVLADLHGLPETTPLARSSMVLTDAQREEHLTKRYLWCKPGPSVRMITGFVWKTIFTFNIDDALEGAYHQQPDRAQTSEPINFDEFFRRPINQSEVQIIHLHGFSQDSTKGYVFSTSEYARVTKGQNPWMHVLSELVASEAFIVAGTSLNEPDLEYYLSSRTIASPRKNRGPSILVEPYPNAITEALCARHNLVLVKANLKDFLGWLKDKLGLPPSVEQLTLPATEDLFSSAPPKLDQIAFFSSFSLIRPLNAMEGDGNLSPFFYGRAPTWQDLGAGLDIPTNDELSLGAHVRNFLENPTEDSSLLLLSAEPGSGKSTCARRAAYNLAKEGKVVFSHDGRSTVDFSIVVKCLAAIKTPFAILIDDAADRAVLIRGLLEATEIGVPFLILCVDRDYRQDHMDRLLGDMNIKHFEIRRWMPDQFIQMIEKYRKFGLVGSSEALNRPKEFSRKLVHDPIAIAACRILNDFRPMAEIVKSVWADGDPHSRISYLIAALAYHCHPSGLQHTILQRASKNDHLNDQFDYFCPLPLTYTHNDDSYVTPLNAVMADRILELVAQVNSEMLLDSFVRLSSAIAPYVNRRSAISRSPEALMAGRLFSAEKVVRPLLGLRATKFYDLTQEDWQWNSRYWEHRALITVLTDIDLAVQYARHAVAIEQHPFPWTTLATILTRKMLAQPASKDRLFSEIYELISKTLQYEAGRMWRASPHPYWSLLSSTQKFIESGGVLSRLQRDFVSSNLDRGLALFRRDPQFGVAVKELSKLLAVS